MTLSLLFKWLEKDEVVERKLKDENITALSEQIKKLDEKLNTLLDGYLDGIIEEETYKKKKNELFERRLKLQEKKAEIEDRGSNWLELLFNGPMTRGRV